LLPSGDNFNVSFDTLDVVYGYTKVADSIRAGFKEHQLIGSIEDPFFGFSKAELVTTISSSTTSGGFGTNPVVDSVILYLAWSDLKGEGDLPFQLRVYEFTEQIRYDSTYYSNMDLTGKYRQPELGSTLVNPGDSIIVIRITGQEFIDKFLAAEDTILESSYYLQDYIYGLYLTTEDTQDEGIIMDFNFDLPNNQLYFYYSNDTLDSLSQYYSLENNNNGRINVFRHDPSGYPLEEYLLNSSDYDSLIFVQSMAGVSSVLRFPGLMHWLDSMPVAINEARLIVPVADTNITLQRSKYLPQTLNLYLIDENGNLARVYDEVLDASGFGGGLDEQTQTYSYTIKTQIQSILAGNVANLDMLLVPGNAASEVTRTGLYGWNQRDHRKRIRLEITYTLL
jgi:hypothetical protein